MCLPTEEVKGHQAASQVAVSKACMFILNPSRETLNCIFHLRTAEMMAPHSKLNQTCIAARRTERQPTTIMPRLILLPIGYIPIQSITCCHTCFLLAWVRVCHTPWRTMVCRGCLSVGTLIVLLQLHNSQMMLNNEKKNKINYLSWSKLSTSNSSNLFPLLVGLLKLMSLCKMLNHYYNLIG